MKTKSKANKEECTQYELDLTDYVRGDMTFLTREKQKKLFDHLRKCAKCREEFFNWEEIYGAMVTRQHHANPETKRKCEELLEKIKKMAQAKMPMGAKEEILLAAGKIHDSLKTYGISTIPVLRERTGIAGYPLYEAIGWLTINELVIHTKDKTNQPAYDLIKDNE